MAPGHRRAKAPNRRKVKAPSHRPHGRQTERGLSALTVTGDVLGVFVVAANDVWVVGDAGTILHYDGCWRAEPNATTRPLRCRASADGTVWAGGAAATTLRRSGGTWSVFTTPGTMAVRVFG